MNYKHSAISSVSVAAGVLLLSRAPVRAASFTYTTLDVPGQYLTNLGAGESINDRDQVVGSTESSDFNYQGFVWQNGTFTLFQQCDILNSINSTGLAVGYDTASFAEYCTVYTSKGVTHVYPVHARGNLALNGVNASGTVVARNTRRGDKTEGLILVGKQTTVFAVPGSQVKYAGTFPTGINDGGSIVGDYTPPGASWDQGFTYTAGSYTLFNVPGALGTYPLFITATGILGGKYLLTGGSETAVGFVLSGSTYTTVNPPGATGSYVVGMGPDGEAVGSWSDQSHVSHGFIYRAGVYYTIDVPGAADTFINGVNAHGSLVGTYFDAQITRHPFIAQCLAGMACTQ